jgi:AraC-like DNA-binding protein
MEHIVLLQNETPTLLGRFRLAGLIRGGSGVEREPPLRVYGAYAVMAVLRGAGEYRDGEGRREPLAAGDVVLVFPEHAHWYGTPRGHTWDELHLTFDGPAFDLWRRAGLLDPSRPVHRAPEGWTDTLRAFIHDAARGGPLPRRLRAIADFQALLAALLLHDGDERSEEIGEATASDWEARARGLLEVDVGRALDLTVVAAQVGLSYETFRKRFQKAVGVSPAHYRMLRRIEAAKELLRYSPQMTNRQVAETLGFADEYHFSKRFTQIAGVTPRTFRRNAPTGDSAESPGT